MKNAIPVFVFFMMMMACERTTTYDKIKQRELSSGRVIDSVFLGIYLGMPMNDFYMHCWNLNKQNLIMQGPGNMSVQYEIDTPIMMSKVYMRFYPEFTDEKISKMPVEFTYEAWSPWNKQFSSDSLLQHLIPLLSDWYNSDFYQEHSKKRNLSVWYNLSGDRQIILFKKDTATVRMEISKLSNQ